MNGYLLDTMIPSELARIKPDVHVSSWLTAANDDELYFSVISIGEICKGFTIHPEAHRRNELRQWLDNTLRPWLAGRILPVTEAISERWGILDGERQLRGRTVSPADGLIAATALEHNLTVVTRNVTDFEGLGISILNPWETGEELCNTAITI